MKLKIKPGVASGLVGVFQRHGVLEESVALPGCHSAEIVISQDESEAIVTATWDDEAAYAGWTGKGSRSGPQVELNSYLREPLVSTTVADVYQIAHVV